MVDPKTLVTKEQIAFSTLVSAAYASAAVALFFLGLDSLRGAPLSTPSLLGSALLLGQDPATTGSSSIGVVAVFSLAHFVAFVTLSAGATLLYVRQGVIQRQPILLSGLILALLSLGAVVVDAWIIPGLTAAIGAIPLLTANTMAAGVIGWFVHASLPIAAPVAAGTSGNTHTI